MILEIQHETRLTYSQPVAEWLSELRLEPLSDANQSCQTFSLTVTGNPQFFRYMDGFGNRVHHFNLMNPALELQALAASVVETHPQEIDWGTSRSTWPLNPEQHCIECMDFLRPGGPITQTSRLIPVLNMVEPKEGMRIVDFISTVSSYIHNSFIYAKAVTSVSSPIEHVLEQGKGVCQDFAHLMIAVLRSFGVPARYVSGYIHRPNQESQSHAWCEAWVPDMGWLGIDPTNNRPPNDHFVKVAVGRNFTDVPPNKGIYRGIGEEVIEARVETRELNRQPTLSWQEQLPKLHVPLTVIQAHLKRDVEGDDGMEQQQQQQQ